MRALKYILPIALAHVASAASDAAPSGRPMTQKEVDATIAKIEGSLRSTVKAASEKASSSSLSPSRRLQQQARKLDGGCTMTTLDRTSYHLNDVCYYHQDERGVNLDSEKRRYNVFAHANAVDQRSVERQLWQGYFADGDYLPTIEQWRIGQRGDHLERAYRYCQIGAQELLAKGEHDLDNFAPITSLPPLAMIEFIFENGKLAKYFCLPTSRVQPNSPCPASEHTFDDDSDSWQYNAMHEQSSCTESCDGKELDVLEDGNKQCMTSDTTLGEEWVSPREAFYHGTALTNVKAEIAAEEAAAAEEARLSAKAIAAVGEHWQEEETFDACKRIKNKYDEPKWFTDPDTGFVRLANDGETGVGCCSENPSNECLELSQQYQALECCSLGECQQVTCEQGYVATPTGVGLCGMECTEIACPDDYGTPDFHWAKDTTGAVRAACVKQQMGTCETWFDGCNECHARVGKLPICTAKFCVEYKTPKCLDDKAETSTE